MRIKDVSILILVVGLMSLLGLIVVDEFMVAMEHGTELDANVVELLQMSITGIIGVVSVIGSESSLSKTVGNKIGEGGILFNNSRFVLTSPQVTVYLIFLYLKYVINFCV